MEEKDSRHEDQRKRVLSIAVSLPIAGFLIYLAFPHNTERPEPAAQVTGSEPAAMPTSAKLELRDGVSCQDADCVAGTAVVASVSKSEPSIACPTLPLAKYTNYVLGLLAMDAQFGIAPDVNPETGDPLQSGKSKEILDKFRADAGVITFDGAMTVCRMLKKGTHFTVANSHASEEFLYASDQQGVSMWWLSKPFLKAKIRRP